MVLILSLLVGIGLAELQLGRLDGILRLTVGRLRVVAGGAVAVAGRVGYDRGGRAVGRLGGGLDKVAQVTVEVM